MVRVSKLRELSVGIGRRVKSGSMNDGNGIVHIVVIFQLVVHSKL